MDRATEMKLARCRAGEDQPIGKDMPEEEKAKKLAIYRVGKGQSMGKNMTPEEITMRRKFIKTMFMRVSPWCNLKDEQLDSVRIFKNGSDWYVEDQDFYEYQF